MTLKYNIETIQYFAVNKRAWPGCYPMYAIASDGACLCHKCTIEHGQVIGDEDGWIDPQWHVVAADINYEDNDLHCAHCNEQIESACGE